MRFLPAFTLALGLVAFATAARAHDLNVGDLELGHPWIAEAPPGAPTAAGYLVITNVGETADRLLAVRCAFAERAEIHEMAIDDAGVMQMRPLPQGLEIPGSGTVTLERGGFHLMFMHVMERPVAGDMIPVTLVFEHAGEVEAMFMVQKPADGGMETHGDMEMESGQ